MKKAIQIYKKENDKLRFGKLGKSKSLRVIDEKANLVENQLSPDLSYLDMSITEAKLEFEEIL